MPNAVPNVSIVEIIKSELMGAFPSILNLQNTRMEYRLIEREGNLSPKSDVFIRLPNKVIAVELEKKQVRPEVNYLKYLRWIDQCKVTEDVYLIQIFSPWYGSGEDDSRILNIKYLREKIMLHKLKYEPIYYANRFTTDEFERFEDNVKRTVISEIVCRINRYIRC